MSDQIQTIDVAQEAAAAERERRQRVLKKGVVSYNDGAISCEVVIRDLSSQGVKLKMTSPIPIPDNITLDIPMDGIRIECQVRWRAGDTLGVMFVSDPQIRGESQRQPFRQSDERGATLRRR